MATTAQLDAKNKKIIITDGTVTAKLDIASQIIYIEDGAGCHAELNVDTGKIDITNADGTTISLALVDLVAASTAQFQDITYIPDGGITFDGTNLSYVTKTARVLCVAPSAASEPTIIDTPTDCT